MNNKLLLQDLIDQLAEQANLKKKDAEEFLKAFFKAIEDSLFEGEVVKIPGLGIFKLILVESRKSVDVTTGEENEIKEHYKLSFIPEQSLKDLVNAPFSYLEPIPLGAVSDKEKAEAEEQNEDAEETEKSTNEPIKSKSFKDIKNSNVEDQIQENEPLREMEPRKNQIPTPNVERKPTQKIPAAKKLDKKAKDPSRAPFLTPFLYILFFLVVVLAVWTFWSNWTANEEKEKKLSQVELFDSKGYEDVSPEEFESQIEDSVKLEAEIQAKMDSLARIKKTNKDEASKPEGQTEVKTLPVKPNAATPVSKPVVAKSTVSWENGAITTTVQPGDRLNTLALKYYGNKIYWVYIYAANRRLIPDPDHIAIGIQLRIPKPDPSRINGNDPDCIAKAKALQAKIKSVQNQ